MPWIHTFLGLIAWTQQRPMRYWWNIPRILLKEYMGNYPVLYRWHETLPVTRILMTTKLPWTEFFFRQRRDVWTESLRTTWYIEWSFMLFHFSNIQTVPVIRTTLQTKCAHIKSFFCTWSHHHELLIFSLIDKRINLSYACSRTYTPEMREFRHATTCMVTSVKKGGLATWNSNAANVLLSVMHKGRRPHTPAMHARAYDACTNKFKHVEHYDPRGERLIHMNRPEHAGKHQVS